ncbi:hypothetical protein BDR03DRAFT_226227 [Suillus americanus]|nr:hypothetical protein BDR03DRAFT_226227 [Suillus americanus]
MMYCEPNLRRIRFETIFRILNAAGSHPMSRYRCSSGQRNSLQSATERSVALCSTIEPADDRYR